jgi:hypothetical protein
MRYRMAAFGGEARGEKSPSGDGLKVSTATKNRLTQRDGTLSF